MAFSLAACGSSGKDEDDEKEETPDYNALVDAFKDAFQNPGLKNLGKVLGGTLAGNEVADYMKVYYDMTSGMDEDDIAEAFLGSGGDLEVQGAEAEDLDEDAIADYQEWLELCADYLRESIEQSESLSDSDLEELAEENGVSVDEFRKMIDDIVSVTQALLDKIDGVKIDAAQRVTITVERSEGETDELEFYFFLSSGKWFSNLLMEELYPDYMYGQ